MNISGFRIGGNSNESAPNSDGFNLEVYFNPSLRPSLLPLRLRFVTSKTRQFKVSPNKRKLAAGSSGEFNTERLKTKSRALTTSDSDGALRGKLTASTWNSAIVQEAETLQLS